jgi:hypothetical protein
MAKTGAGTGSSRAIKQTAARRRRVAPVQVAPPPMDDIELPASGEEIIDAMRTLEILYFELGRTHREMLEDLYTIYSMYSMAFAPVYSSNEDPYVKYTKLYDYWKRLSPSRKNEMLRVVQDDLIRPAADEVQMRYIEGYAGEEMDGGELWRGYDPRCSKCGMSRKIK